MSNEATPTRFAAAQDADGELNEADRRQGARLGDVRIRRTREQRRGVRHALRGFPRAIRRAVPLR